MRVPDTTRMATLLLTNQRTSARLLDLSRQASSGERVNQPSDDPAAFVAIASRDGVLARLGDRSRVLGRVAGDLDLAESALASASDVVARARDLATEMANGTVDAATRATAAAEVAGLRDALIAAGNTRGAGGYLFGGTQTGTPPFTSAGTFVGDDQARTAEIADGVTARSNPSGSRALTAAGGSDVLADLTSLAAALSANDQSAITTLVGTLGSDHQQVVTERVATGMIAGRLRSAAAVSDASQLAVSQARNHESGVDPTAVYTSLVAARSAYERSLAVTQKILSLGVS